MHLSQKEAGAYYTPDAVVSSLTRWAVRGAADRLLDPSCGDGRFVSAFRNSVGIERDVKAAAIAMKRAPWADIHEGDFFDWAAHTHERFECAAGNPPFIRYQTFKGEVRNSALRLCAALGAKFSGLTASWAPFLVATSSLLKPGGRMAFVVPDAIGHAPYAAPLLDYVVERFGSVQIIAVREKLFPELSEDCWLLFADDFGGSTAEIRFTVLERFEPLATPPREALRVSVREWRQSWNRRLRPYLLPQNARELYRLVASHAASLRFGKIAEIGIGYVSGANQFFHLRPSQAAAWDIPDRFLWPTVRNGRALPDRELTARTLEEWRRFDIPMMLLRIPRNAELSPNVSKYLESNLGKQAREAYKCRTRTPWYSVPHVRVPDFFLTYMSGLTPNLVRNLAAASCTNAVHGVHVRNKKSILRVVDNWHTPFVRLSCELEGHPLGGGMLKLEPREAAGIVFPASDMVSRLSSRDITEAVSTMRCWRHYGG